MKRFLPTPTQARNMILVGMPVLILSPILLPEFSRIFQALGAGLVLVGVLCNGYAALIATVSAPPPSSDDGPKQ